MISEPGSESKNLKTGDTPLYDPAEMDMLDELMPESDADYIWS